eukprot:CAMPEP_0185789972 /NCGR_PEP_ID=MMETSP1174-20130828/153778_1 /TAXON_ID=35687 /ORGANISM="Dictyocha speculum, Strain CCMP1381" /LENGTH=41 /DNA_ID= /DNA_START= /DNA_END= /DNA_ORIENTATION=
MVVDESPAEMERPPSVYADDDTPTEAYEPGVSSMFFGDREF